MSTENKRPGRGHPLRRNCLVLRINCHTRRILRLQERLKRLGGEDNGAESTKRYLPNNLGVYSVLVSLVQSSEQVRWTRLNSFLVLESFLFTAGTSLLLLWKPPKGTCLLENQVSTILTVIGGLGIIFALLWALLLRQSSRYLHEYLRMAKKMDSSFPEPRPFSDVSYLYTPGLGRSRFIFYTICGTFGLLFFLLIVAAHAW